MKITKIYDPDPWKTRIHSSFFVDIHVVLVKLLVNHGSFYQNLETRTLVHLDSCRSRIHVYESECTLVQPYYFPPHQSWYHVQEFILKIVLPCLPCPCFRLDRSRACQGCTWTFTQRSKVQEFPPREARVKIEQFREILLVNLEVPVGSVQKLTSNCNLTCKSLVLQVGPWKPKSMTSLI